MAGDGGEGSVLRTEAGEGGRQLDLLVWRPQSVGGASSRLNAA